MTFSVSPEIEAERPWVHAAPGVRSELVCNVLADPDAKVSVISHLVEFQSAVFMHIINLE
jgi:hypothetical protein